MKVTYDGKNLTMPAELFFKKKIKRAPMELYCLLADMIREANQDYVECTYERLMKKMDKERVLVSLWTKWLKQHKLIRVEKRAPTLYRFRLLQEKC